MEKTITTENGTKVDSLEVCKLMDIFFAKKLSYTVEGLHGLISRGELNTDALEAYFDSIIKAFVVAKENKEFKPVLYLLKSINDYTPPDSGLNFNHSSNSFTEAIHLEREEFEAKIKPALDSIVKNGEVTLEGVCQRIRRVAEDSSLGAYYRAVVFALLSDEIYSEATKGNKPLHRKVGDFLKGILS